MSRNGLKNWLPTLAVVPAGRRGGSWLLAVALVASAVVLSGEASAQSPPGCNTNSLNFPITRTPAQIPNGGIVTYGVSVSNVDPGTPGDIACGFTQVN